MKDSIMIPDDLLQECFEILRDTSLLEEDATEKVQALISSRTSLRGPMLDNTTLDVLWRHHQNGTPGSSPPLRHTIVRTASPSPWQIPRVSTPSRLGSTPPITGPLFPASLSHRSPFPSPRPSPRLAYNTPMIPHSPSLQAYEPIMPGSAGTSPPEEESYNFDSETVDWLLADDGGGERAAALSAEMSPFDMLRAVFGEHSDEEMNRALEKAGYDLGTALTMLSEKSASAKAEEATRMGGFGGGKGEVLIGKSVTPTPAYARPVTPRNGVVCRFYLSTGQCLRADCRFSHDLSSTICKYWLQGSCLAGETCIFSHDPTMAAYKVSTENHVTSHSHGHHNHLGHHNGNMHHGHHSGVGAGAGGGGGMLTASNSTPQKLALQDPSAFPSLGDHHNNANWTGASTTPTTPRHGFRQLHISRPSSRQQSREPPLAVDDTEAFPSLGSAVSKAQKKKNQRNNSTVTPSKQDTGSSTPSGLGLTNAGNIPTGPASLADLVRMSPSPSPGSKRWGNHHSPQKPRAAQRGNAVAGNSGNGPASNPTASPAASVSSVSTAATTATSGGAPTAPASQSSTANSNNSNNTSQQTPTASGPGSQIPPSPSLPWHDPHHPSNKAYLTLRTLSLKHGSQRNKYLSAAAAAWSRHDAKAAKSLSLRASAENESMRRAQRDASRELEASRKRDKSLDIAVDVSGLAPEEAGGHVVRLLCELERETERGEETRKWAYVIGAGPGRAGKGVGKGVRIALEKGGWWFREFGGGQGVVGVEIWRGGRGVRRREKSSTGAEEGKESAEKKAEADDGAAEKATDGEATASLKPAAPATPQRIPGILPNISISKSPSTSSAVPPALPLPATSTDANSLNPTTNGSNAPCSTNGHGSTPKSSPKLSPKIPVAVPIPIPQSPARPSFASALSSPVTKTMNGAVAPTTSVALGGNGKAPPKGPAKLMKAAANRAKEEEVRVKDREREKEAEKEQVGAGIVFGDFNADESESQENKDCESGGVGLGLSVGFGVENDGEKKDEDVGTGQLGKGGE